MTVREMLLAITAGDMEWSAAFIQMRLIQPFGTAMPNVLNVAATSRGASGPCTGRQEEGR